MLFRSLLSGVTVTTASDVVGHAGTSLRDARAKEAKAKRELAKARAEVATAKTRLESAQQKLES